MKPNQPIKPTRKFRKMPMWRPKQGNFPHAYYDPHRFRMAALNATQKPGSMKRQTFVAARRALNLPPWTLAKRKLVMAAYDAVKILFHTHGFSGYPRPFGHPAAMQLSIPGDAPSDALAQLPLRTLENGCLVMDVEEFMRDKPIPDETFPKYASPFTGYHHESEE